MADEISYRDWSSLPALHNNHGDSLPSRIVSQIDEEDAKSRYREEAADNGYYYHNDRNDSVISSEEETPRHIVGWKDGDLESPFNWSSTRKGFYLCITMTTIINSTMGSSLPSNAVPFIMKEWGVESPQQAVLPMSVYLIGYVFGPLFWAPMSEQFGRRDITVGTFLAFMVWTMACALAPSWPGFLFFRLFCGVFASAPIAVVTGTMADMYNNPVTRGRAMAAFMVGTVFGPLIAPIVSGYCSPTIGWRWTFWIGLICQAVCLVPLLFLPETYGPVLLKRRAARMRKADPACRAVAPHELERRDLRQLATVVLTRPLRMAAYELIVSSTCCYVALLYAIFYMTFQAFPIVFQRIHGLSPGECGLVFLSIGVGGILATPVFFWWDAYLIRAERRGAPWTKQEEYRRLPLACFGGPMFAISMFWLGWSAKPDIHWVVPMLAGLPFGIGFMLIFMALLNYLTDAYEIFAASANAAASCARALLAVVLPLASTPMFERLGVSGGCSLLGGLSLLMCAIPFIFIWKGETIRQRSRFCIALKERKAEMSRKKAEEEKRTKFGREKTAIDGSVLQECRETSEEKV